LFYKYAMKHFIIAAALVALPAQAELEKLAKVIYCDTHEAIFTPLVKEFREQPVWTGSSDKHGTRLVLTANTKTGTWTVVEYGEDFACVIAVGREHKFLASPAI
jgi:hypothetical protein